jgi:photoactive yellow protein
MTELIRFDQLADENVLSKMKKDDIDSLAFGAILIDKHGTVLEYNAAETAITGRDASDVLGKNFFTEVAPCTQSDIFYGKFKDGAQTGQLQTMFEYVFDYEMTPTKVKIFMKNDVIDPNTFWIFVKRI